MADLDISKEKIAGSAEEQRGWERLLLPLYWLAGARWATLSLLPETERERVAVIGSSVLIPTLLAFFGMYLYVSSRFNEPRPVVAVVVAIGWSFVIMNIDRILLATYRPFQPWFRKALQVCFRIGLAGVVSIAIAFPFCLEQYRGAIKERLQSEFYKRLHDIKTKEQDERKVFETQDAITLKKLSAQLDKIQEAGPTDPQLYAEEQAKRDLYQQNDSDQKRKEQIEREKSTAYKEWNRESGRIREIEQDRRSEEKGTLPPERGGTGKPGRLAKYDELSRSLEQAKLAERALRQRYEQLLKLSALEPDLGRNSLSDSKRAAYLREGESRKTEFEVLNQEIKEAKAYQTKHLTDHESHYNPIIQSYQTKARGKFDPMEETIGLFKVVFTPEPDSGEADNNVQQYKWIAALFQFSIVFGTLFLLDLIAILSKVMTRPGPYDVLVEFPEFVSTQNIIAFKKEYPRFSDAWAEKATHLIPINGDANDTNVDLRQTGVVARLLLRTHLPISKSSGGKVHAYRSSSYTESPTDEVARGAT